MELRIRLAKDGDGWTAKPDGSDEVISGPDRDACLAAVQERLPGADMLIVETVPELAGVAEASAVLGWDKRRVITYVRRGSFPQPVQALAGGRVWLLRDVEEFARAWRARQAERRRRSP